MEIHRKHKGALAELLAISWLLKQGYEVYRNVSPHGLCDIIGEKNDKIIKIDVKTGYISPLTGEMRVPDLSEEQTKNGIRAIAVFYTETVDQCFWGDEIPGWDKKREITKICPRCEKEFTYLCKSKHMANSKIYCSNICQSRQNRLTNKNKYIKSRIS